MPPTSLAGISVLLLEDDTQPESGLASYLSDRGASVASAPDAAKALHRLDALPKPNVIVCDLDWPDLLGWDLWAKLQAELQLGQIPVIAMTDQSTGLQAATDAGFQSILLKPVQWRRVEKSILSVLARYPE